MTTTRYVSNPDPIITVWTYHGDDGLAYGGISPSDDREFVRAIETYGHAAVTDSRYARPSNHNVASIGVGHDDARFSETGGREGSMAAYYENGDAHGGPWWTPGSFAGRKHYGTTAAA